MGAEDFAFVMQKAPGVFVRFGSRSEGGPYGGSIAPTFTVTGKLSPQVYLHLLVLL